MQNFNVDHHRLQLLSKSEETKKKEKQIQTKPAVGA